jgi:hypothetical protein
MGQGGRVVQKGRGGLLRRGDEACSFPGGSGGKSSSGLLGLGRLIGPNEGETETVGLLFDRGWTIVGLVLCCVRTRNSPIPLSVFGSYQCELLFPIFC